MTSHLRWRRLSFLRLNRHLSTGCVAFGEFGHLCKPGGQHSNGCDPGLFRTVIP